MTTKPRWSWAKVFSKAALEQQRGDPDEFCPQCGGALDWFRGPVRQGRLYTGWWREGVRCLECAWGQAIRVHPLQGGAGDQRPFLVLVGNVLDDRFDNQSPKEYLNSKKTGPVGGRVATMRIAAHQLRVADIVRIPGRGEFEISRRDVSGGNVRVWFRTGDEGDSMVSPNIVFEAEMMVEIQRPGSLFENEP